MCPRRITKGELEDGADTDRFWGVFWLDGSSHQALEREYERIGRMCRIGEDPDQIRQWLSNLEKPWLLIIDNADDPSLDIAQYFPAGNRGTILVTTRNPECQFHETVGTYEVGRLSCNDAITLLLRTAAIKESSQSSRQAANLVVETLGLLALAIVQAGAFIREKLCTLDEYCSEYSWQRQELLRHRPKQGRHDYAFTAYTTWEISTTAIRKKTNQTADTALWLLQIFSFWHWEGISGRIFEEASVPSEANERLRLRLLEPMQSQARIPCEVGLYSNCTRIFNDNTLLPWKNDTRIKKAKSR